MSQEIPAMVVTLLHQRQAMLATVHEGNPHAGMVAATGTPDGQAILLHLSQLAAHTRHLLVHPAVALLWCEPDRADVADVQTLARLTVLAVSKARSASTSIEIKPSAPLVRSKTGRRRAMASAVWEKA